MHMNFPNNELAAYRNRLDFGLPTYTTRVSAERGRYHVGQIVSSPLGRLHIIEVRTFNEGDLHPFNDELTLDQRQQIHGVFDVIRFTENKVMTWDIKIGFDPFLLLESENCAVSCATARKKRGQ